MSNPEQDQRRLTRKSLEELNLRGLCESEFWYLKAVTDWGLWYSHKLKQLACIREHIDDPGRLLFELVRLNLAHPDQAQAASAQAKLQSWEEDFNPCTNPKGLIFEREILTFGISPTEIEYLQTRDDWGYWLSYKLKQLECIRTHIEDPMRMLLALAQLNFDHSHQKWDPHAAFQLLVWEAGGYRIWKPVRRAATSKRKAA